MKKLLLIIAVSIFMVNCTAQRNYVGVINEKNGKVGIGTNAPDELLTVKGKIHTQEVLVDLEGAVAPDYVFENYYNGLSLLKPSYSFLKLSDIENFIKKNHHLPKVPSAKQLTAEGMNLKKMNLLLLEKVEELTLHTIAQQKQLDMLTERLSKIENATIENKK